MNWMQITSALFIIAMMILIFPRMKHAIKHSPKGSMQDWMGFIVPMALVVLLILFLTTLV